MQIALWWGHRQVEETRLFPCHFHTGCLYIEWLFTVGYSCWWWWRCFFFLNGVRVSKWTIKDNFATRIWRSHSSTLHIALYPPFYIPHFTFSLQHDLYCVTSELRLSSKVWCRSQYRAARRTHVWFWSGLSMCCCGFQLCLKAPLGFSISYFSKTWKIRFVFSLPAVILKLKGIL